MQATRVAVKESARDMAHILVVDDERSICELLEITFRKEGYRVEVANSVDAAKRKLESQLFDIVISDVRMPGAGGVDLLKFTKEIAPGCFFLLITGVPTVETAIAAINSGADRYVIKDHQLVDQLRRAVREVAESLKWKREAGYLRRELRRLTGLDNIIGQSPKMRAIFELIQTIAPQTSRVLITGESGTGKELVARAIHENSLRVQEPFITINCGAFPETLLESELFGYMKGAFTGANENRQGLFQAANGGTLFMDEIGNMSLTMQVKLYRVLQEGKVRPIGSTEETDVDVRIIAATNKDFEKEIAEGRFREDLYYRFSCPPCASGVTIFLSWQCIFWSVSAKPWKKRSKEFLPRPCGVSSPTTGREMCANSKIPWSALLRLRPAMRLP
jgi:two-component system, NtrC family, response regulator PilR